MSIEEAARRAPVQGTHSLKRGPGTIAWWEHEKAWEAYHAKWRSYQSAERIAERGGFDFAELVDFLGHEPTTWEARS